MKLSLKIISGIVILAIVIIGLSLVITSQVKGHPEIVEKIVDISKTATENEITITNDKVSFITVILYGLGIVMLFTAFIVITKYLLKELGDGNEKN